MALGVKINNVSQTILEYYRSVLSAMLFAMQFIRETLPNNLQAAIFETRIEWEKSKLVS